jgi:AraC-like DNA-binding protein
VRRGVSLESLLAKSFITLKHGDSRDVVSPLQHTLLCMNTTMAFDDATHGLARSGMDAAYTSIGLRMALGCATLEGAILALGRLYGRASNAVGIQLKTEHESAILSVHMDAEDESDVAFLEENYLGWIFIQVLHFLGHAPPITEVTLRDPTHFCLGLTHWAIPGPTRHGDVTRFRFPRRYLSASPAARAGANIMWECQLPWLALLQGGAPSSATHYVTGDGFVRFAHIVRESGKSASTLRRHLQASDAGFRDARRRALMGEATRRLCESEQSIEELSSDLGYADVRSFRRFVKGATGLTPQQIRDRGRVSAPDDNGRAFAALESICAQLNF